MEALAGSRPFPYWRDSFVEWTVFGPVPQDRQEEVRNNLLAGKSPAGLSPVQTRGGNLYFRTRAGAEGLFPKTKPGNTAWAETTFHSPVEGTMHAMVGFDAPARSTRRCSGVPAAGEWSQCGTRIWVNGKEMKIPRLTNWQANGVTKSIHGIRPLMRYPLTTRNSGGPGLLFPFK